MKELTMVESLAYAEGSAKLSILQALREAVDAKNIELIHALSSAYQRIANVA